MSVGSNIKKLRIDHHLTQEELGKIADVSSMAVSQWENDRAVPRMGAVQLLADYFGVQKSAIIDDDSMGEFSTQPSVSYEVVGSVEVPVYGKVHAGILAEHDEVVDTTRIPDFVATQSPNVFVVHSEGDCMDKDFGINDDLVINPDKEPINGSIVVAILDGAEYIVRRLIKTAQTIILAPNSHNPEHKDIVITADSGRTVEIGGVVIWNQSRKLLD